MLYRIFNLRNIYGTIAFVSLICIIGAMEAEMYVTAVALVVVFAVTAYLSMKENGKIK